MKNILSVVWQGYMCVCSLPVYANVNSTYVHSDFKADHNIYMYEYDNHERCNSNKVIFIDVI